MNIPQAEDSVFLPRNLSSVTDESVQSAHESLNESSEAEDLRAEDESLDSDAVKLDSEEIEALEEMAANLKVGIQVIYDS